MPLARWAAPSIVALVTAFVVTVPASGQERQPAALSVPWRASAPVRPIAPEPTAVRLAAPGATSLPAPGNASDGPRLPLIGALVGGAFLGALALGECDSIGCTSPLPVALAVGVGAGAGALTGWVIQKLRTRAAQPDPSETASIERADRGRSQLAAGVQSHGTSCTTTLPNCCPL